MTLSTGGAGIVPFADRYDATAIGTPALARHRLEVEPCSLGNAAFAGFIEAEAKGVRLDLSEGTNPHSYSSHV
jgi:hypothetical protein